MTWRIIPLTGAALAALTLATLLPGCGGDGEADGRRERACAAAADQPASADGRSWPAPAGCDATGDLCEIAEDAAAELQANLGSEPIMSLTLELFEAILPATDGQLRRDVELVIETTRSIAQGQPVSDEATEELAEASARFAPEMARRCPDLELAGV